MKKIALAGLLALAGAAHGVELYNNGPVVDGAGLSVLASPAITLGFGNQTASGNYVADDFSVTGNGWNVASINLYGYQTGAAGFTFNSASWSIISGDVNTGTVVASGVSSVSNGGLAGYRVTSSTLSSTARAIYTVQVDIPDVTLAAGHYWLSWGLTGTAASGPWAPPTSDARLGNAAQSTGGGDFLTLNEAGSGKSVELPFALQGSVVAVPEPETYAMLLAGLGLIGLARRRAVKR